LLLTKAPETIDAAPYSSSNRFRGASTEKENTGYFNYSARETAFDEELLYLVILEKLFPIEIILNGLA
jgi:hypothetical protein